MHTVVDKPQQRTNILNHSLVLASDTGSLDSCGAASKKGLWNPRIQDFRCQGNGCISLGCVLWCLFWWFCTILELRFEVYWHMQVCTLMASPKGAHTLHHEGIVLSNTAFKARETCSSIVLEGLWRAIKRFMTPLRSADWSFECVDCTERVLLVCRDVQSASRCSLLESTIYKIHPSGSATFKRVTPHRKCWSSHSVGSREFWWICWSCSCDCRVLFFVGLFIWHHAVFIIIET